MTLLTRIAAFLAAAALSPAALAAESSMDKADVAWMLVSTTLVLFMTIPGIALFYGGMARKKNVLSILAQTTVICCALTLVWFIAGYSLAFGPATPSWAASPWPSCRASTSKACRARSPRFSSSASR